MNSILTGLLLGLMVGLLIRSMEPSHTPESDTSTKDPDAATRATLDRARDEFGGWL